MSDDKTLGIIKDLLLPSLSEPEDSPYIFDMRAHYKGKRGLSVVGYKEGKKVRRFISEGKIDDKTYKWEWRPMIDGMKDELDGP